MAIVKTLSIEVQNQTYQIIGGDFYEMLEAVKSVTNRRWDGDRKLWRLPISLDKAKETFNELGYQIVGDDDDLLDAEIKEIERFRALLGKHQQLAQDTILELEEKRSGYSFRTKSRIAEHLSRDAACLRGAIKGLEKPIESLTEIEIRSIKRACNILEIGND